MDGMCRSIYIWRRIHLLYAHIHYALPLLCHIILLHMAYDYNICRVGDKEGWHDLSCRSSSAKAPRALKLAALLRKKT